MRRRSPDGGDDYGNVNFFFVAPEYRGNGFGGQLIAYAAEWCRAQGPKALFLRTGRENLRAQKCYEKNGFCRNPSRDSEDELAYVKRVAGSI